MEMTAGGSTEAFVVVALEEAIEKRKRELVAEVTLVARSERPGVVRW